MSLDRTAPLSPGIPPAQEAHDKYSLAWKLLFDQLPNVSDLEKARAKCWLTYRAFDGEVLFQDWLNLVDSVQLQWSPFVAQRDRARWEVSYSAAKAFTLLMHNHQKEWRTFAEQAVAQCVDGALQDWPPVLLTAQRMMALLAYDDWLIGNGKAASDRCLHAWQITQRSVAQLDWSLWPWHTQHEVWPLHVLACVGMYSGACKPVEKGPWGGFLKLTRKGKTTVPLIHSLAALSNRAPDPSHVIFPDPDKTEREVLADYAGDGLFVELGVAAGAFAERVLDRNRGMRYVGIDKWDDHHNAEEMKRADATVFRFGGRAELRKTTFEEAVRRFKDESCDVIYVDGYAHTGQDEGKTLRDWWPKVKAGGVFSGHDYDEKWPKTVAAVDAFAESVGAAVEVIKDEPFSSWAIRKPVK